MLQRVGFEAESVHGSTLYGRQAGVVLYGKADGTTGRTAAPTAADQFLGWNGTDLAYGPPATTKAVAADVTHTQSSTTLSDVTGLLVPVSASATEAWFWEAYLRVISTSVVGDLKVGFTVPASATMQWGTLSATANVAGFITTALASTPTAFNTQSGTQSFGGGNNTFGVALAGWIFGGGTAGNVQMQFAQDATNASDLTIGRGSMLRYRRVLA